MIESQEEVSARIVEAVAREFFEIEVRPQFPLLTWEDCPRRIKYTIMAKALLLADTAVSVYNESMKLNGYEPMLGRKKEEE